MKIKKFDLKLMQKKGETSGTIKFLVGALIVVVLATALAPTMFSNVALLNTTATGGSVPTWVPTVLYVIIGAGIVFLIWRAFGNR